MTATETGPPITRSPIDTAAPSQVAEANVRTMREALVRIHVDTRPAFLMGVLAYVAEQIDPDLLACGIAAATDSAASIGGVR